MCCRLKRYYDLYLYLFISLFQKLRDVDRVKDLTGLKSECDINNEFKLRNRKENDVIGVRRVARSKAVKTEFYSGDDNYGEKAFWQLN